MEKEKTLDAKGTYIMNFVEFVINYSVECKLVASNNDFIFSNMYYF